MIRIYRILLLSALICLVALTCISQTRKKPIVKKAVAKPEVTSPTPTPTPQTSSVPSKRNERPQDGQSTSSSGPTEKPAQVEQPYFYEFTQPKFTITRITITHDENGKGTLTFTKGEFDEPITEPIQLSKMTLDKIAVSLTALDFLNSTENYQYEKDYSHLGNVTFRLKKDGREREIRVNYTTNKNAKDLLDEYRRISNQVIWIFDMNVSRENQPLNAPVLVDGLQSYLERKEISDPNQMVPFLQALSQDERIPLIARNHAGKIVKQIEKEKK